jgi:hypothetical protein
MKAFFLINTLLQQCFSGVSASPGEAINRFNGFLPFLQTRCNVLPFAT